MSSAIVPAQAADTGVHLDLSSVTSVDKVAGQNVNIYDQYATLSYRANQKLLLSGDAGMQQNDNSKSIMFPSFHNNVFIYDFGGKFNFSRVTSASLYYGSVLTDLPAFNSAFNSGRGYTLTLKTRVF